MKEISLRFERGSASVASLRAAIEAVLTEPEIASREDVPERVDVREEGHGVDPLTVAVVVTLVKLSGHITTDVWDDVIWPRVRKRLGDDDALGERKDS